MKYHAKHKPEAAAPAPSFDSRFFKTSLAFFNNKRGSRNSSSDMSGFLYNDDDFYDQKPFSGAIFKSSDKRDRKRVYKSMVCNSLLRNLWH